ncbi:hypothetical protein AC578_2915 [Pseudocercospora eumusae]|uniref:Translation initiation factor IF-2, mitochondrial n=1 Tax=Pseudocercospora eumusae TaxID=321146 RepID=A0A139HEH2_9PEZI|nr:hypothetical protein AC578_2915 [Pseudocercospora eumusae]
MRRRVYTIDMRRQRVLRTSSAQSLCIFCACRLRIEVPAIPARTRQFSATPIPRQPTAAVTASSAENSTNHGALPAWYDPTSSLSMSEQREKQERMQATQKRDVEQNQAVQEPIWRAQRDVSRSRHASRRLDLGPRDTAEPSPITTHGTSMAHAMKQSASAMKQTRADTLAGMRRRTFHIRRTDQDSSGQRMSAKGGNADRGAKRGRNAFMRPLTAAAPQSTTAIPRKVSNPFAGASGAAASSNGGNSITSAATGWGAASTGAAPLSYSDAVIEASRPKIETSPHGVKFEVGLDQKSFRPSYDPSVEDDTQQVDQDATDEELRSQQEAYDRAAQSVPRPVEDSYFEDFEPEPSQDVAEGQTTEYDLRSQQEVYDRASQNMHELPDEAPADRQHTFRYTEPEYEPANPARAQHPDTTASSSKIVNEETVPKQTSTNLGSFGSLEPADAVDSTAEKASNLEQRPYAESEPQTYDFPRNPPLLDTKSVAQHQQAAARSPASALADSFGTAQSKAKKHAREAPQQEKATSPPQPTADSWDAEEIETLKDLSRSGVSYKEIASMLGHSPASTLAQMRKAFARVATPSATEVSTPEVETQARPARAEPSSASGRQHMTQTNDYSIPEVDTQAEPKRPEPSMKPSRQSQNSVVPEVDSQARPQRAGPQNGFGLGRNFTASIDNYSRPEVDSQAAQPRRADPSPQSQTGGWGLGGPKDHVRRNSEPVSRQDQIETLQSPAYNSTGYRAMPFEASEFQSEAVPFDEEQSANWQHLRRRDSAPAKSPAQPSVDSPPDPQRQRVRNPFMDDAWVHQTFENHQRDREKRQRYVRPVESGQSNNPAIQDAGYYSRNLFADEDLTNKRCARCGRVGHVARQCPSKRDLRSCLACGQPGHVQANCPNRSAQGQLSSNRSRSTEPRSRMSNPFDDTSRSTDSRQEPRNRGQWGDDADAKAKTEARERRMAKFGQNAPSVQDSPVAAREEPKPSRASRWADEDEAEAPAASREIKEKAARRSRWEDADVEEHGRDRGRKAQRGGRREFDEDEDEEADAREAFRARKAERQAEKERKRDQERRAAERKRKADKAEGTTPISLPEFVSVQQLSQLLGVRYDEFVERLEELGYDDVFPGKTLNSETSTLIAMEYNFEPTFDGGEQEAEERDLKPQPEAYDKSMLPERPPVVTIMGHVDHGKTTILDYLRKSSVAAGEAGGITQHIGAFSVPLASSGKTITFLDTPGHAAFLAMRQRGANVTDIVILVVAADDSVKPQTLEAIKHAKAAGVPMIVAINKVDKEEADIQRVKQDLARHGVEIEDFGGETQVVEVSGKTGQGMDELEENIVTLSEVLDHRAETDGAVEGWVLEATTKKSGRVATVLVRRGTLKPGNVIVAGKTWARVRSLRNEGGKTLQSASPGMPVEVDGWKDQPMAGDEVLEAPSEQKANDVVEFRLEKDERERTASDTEAINESRRIAQERQSREKAASLAAKQAQRSAARHGGAAEGPSNSIDAPERDREQSGQMEVPFIIKADVSGSAEAVSAYIMSVSNPLITPKILSSQVGSVHESDIEMANAAGGHIISFNLPPDPEMQGAAESRGVKILENNIIYRVLDDVKSVLEDKLPPIVSQRVLGEAEVSAAFEISIGGRKKMKIAGCKVRNGVIRKKSRVRVTRNGEKIHDGTISSLKNVKKDVTEMGKGTECGIGFDDWQDFEVGDQIQTYEEISEKRKL